MATKVRIAQALKNSTLADKTLNLSIADEVDPDGLSCSELFLDKLFLFVPVGNEYVMQGKGTRNISLNSFPTDLTQHYLYTTRDEWMEFFRERETTSYHSVGIHQKGEGCVGENVVVDERLGLWVVDCSVMPRIPGGHTGCRFMGLWREGVVEREYVPDELLVYVQIRW